jgi:uncharacterized protein (DUF433 family)
MGHKTPEEKQLLIEKKQRELEALIADYKKDLETTPKCISIYNEGHGIAFIARTLKMKEESLRLTLLKLSPYKYFKRGDITLRELRTFARDAAIADDVEKGNTLEEVATRYNLSVARIDDIVKTYKKMEETFNAQKENESEFLPSRRVFSFSFPFGTGIHTDNRFTPSIPFDKEDMLDFDLADELTIKG